jgi:hypothetical protein
MPKRIAACNLLPGSVLVQRSRSHPLGAEGEVGIPGYTDRRGGIVSGSSIVTRARYFWLRLVTRRWTVEGKHFLAEGKDIPQPSY